MIIKSHLAAVISLGAVWLLLVSAVFLVQDGSSPVELADTVWKGHWRTDDEAIPCAEDPACGYGNVNIDPAAYSDPSPLAIINEDYKPGQLNPFPGPKNYGPDQPYSWLPEEAMDDIPARKVWPDYPEPKAAAAADRRPQMAILRMLPDARMVERPLVELVRRY